MPFLQLTRRDFLAGGTAATGILAMPALSRAARRPVLTHGLQSGDPSHDGAMIWGRADRPARMLVEIATTESFADARRLPPVDVTEATGFAGKLLAVGLPADQEVLYRVRLADLADLTIISEPLVGRFRTAPQGLRDITFLWSGDTAGQGWGIDESRGGMLTYRSMMAHRPDFFVHCGDTIYADAPIPPEIALPDGTVWRNLVTEETSKVAETLEEFRHNHLYNLLDSNVRAFNAEVPILAQWNDHETVNNWYPDEMLANDDRYQVKSAALLSARANRAFREMLPIRESAAEPGRIYRKISYGPRLDLFFLDMRSYRAANSANDQPTQSPATAYLGREQIRWLKTALATSRATWKVISADMPLGLIVRDGATAFENSSNGDGPVRGREFDIADVLGFIRHAGVANVVWITADAHYTAAHHYSPDRARFQDFNPFWEFVSGPLHATAHAADELDDTFGPEVRFARAPLEKEEGLPPSAGLQFFGKVAIAGRTGEMTVSLLNRANEVLWSTVLAPDPV